MANVDTRGRTHRAKTRPALGQQFGRANSRRPRGGVCADGGNGAGGSPRGGVLVLVPDRLGRRRYTLPRHGGRHHQTKPSGAGWLGPSQRARNLVTRQGRFVPDRGDIVKTSFDPQSEHEQAGWRPALVISPAAYNRASSLALFCPITSRVKGYPFEIALPSGLAVSGVVLADQVRSLDWKAR